MSISLKARSRNCLVIAATISRRRVGFNTEAAAKQNHRAVSDCLPTENALSAPPQA
jgi:hypothetical protein